MDNYCISFHLASLLLVWKCSFSDWTGSSQFTGTAKAVGYAWVLLWLAFSLTPFTNGYIKSGYGRGVALYSNCGVDGYLPSFVMAGGSNSTTMGLLQALSYRGLFLAAAVAVLAVVRRMVIPGKRLVDMSLIGL